MQEAGRPPPTANTVFLWIRMAAASRELITATLFIFCMTSQLLPLTRCLCTSMNVHAQLSYRRNGELREKKKDPNAFTPGWFSGCGPGLLVLESSCFLSPKTPGEPERMQESPPKLQQGPGKPHQRVRPCTQWGPMGT